MILPFPFLFIVFTKFFESQYLSQPRYYLFVNKVSLPYRLAVECLSVSVSIYPKRGKRTIIPFIKMIRWCGIFNVLIFHSFIGFFGSLFLPNETRTNIRIRMRRPSTRVEVGETVIRTANRITAKERIVDNTLFVRGVVIVAEECT